MKSPQCAVKGCAGVPKIGNHCPWHQYRVAGILRIHNHLRMYAEDGITETDRRVSILSTRVANFQEDLKRPAPVKDDPQLPPGFAVQGPYVVPVPTAAECESAAAELERVFPPLQDPHIAAILVALAGAGINTTPHEGETDGARAVRGVGEALEAYLSLENLVIAERDGNAT